MDLSKKMIFSGTEFYYTIKESEIIEGINDANSNEKMKFILKLLKDLTEKQKLSILKNIGENLNKNDFSKFDKMILQNIKQRK